MLEIVEWNMFNIDEVVLSIMLVSGWVLVLEFWGNSWFDGAHI